MWGRENEGSAREAYVKYMHSNGHPGLIATATVAGFIVHFDKCWLGTSPDAWVTDPQLLVDDIGLAEFNCPYTKAFTTPERACKDSEFCCVMVNGKLQLRQNHYYYHQVQLQLYVYSFRFM